MYYVNHHITKWSKLWTYQEELSILLTLENRHNHGRFRFIKRGQHVTGSHSSHNNCKYSRRLNQFNIATSSFLLVKVHDIFASQGL